MDEATKAPSTMRPKKKLLMKSKDLRVISIMIVIAHRLTTVQHCDRIYRLEKGQIVEEGTPEQVINIAN